jgi:hypothetical protein
MSSTVCSTLDLGTSNGNDNALSDIIGCSFRISACEMMAFCCVEDPRCEWMGTHKEGDADK